MTRLETSISAQSAAAQRPAPAQPPEGGGGDLRSAAVKVLASCNRPHDLDLALDELERAVRRTPIVPATPSAAPGGSDRERVAEALWRSDNPGEDDLGWREWCAYVAKCNNPPALTKEIKACLRRADAILAITPQPASPGAGERVPAAWPASYQETFDAISAAVTRHGDKSLGISVRAFYRALAYPDSPTAPDAAGAEVEPTGLAKQVGDQCRVVSHLATALARVHSDYAKLVGSLHLIVSSNRSENARLTLWNFLAMP